MLDKIAFYDLTYDFCESVFNIERDNILEAWSMDNIRTLVGDEKARARVGVCDGKVVCYYSYYRIVDEGFVNNLAVDKSCHGKGVGSLLMQDMINKAKEDKLSALTLEVEDGNDAAIGLYKKYGFEEEGRRYCFYKNKRDAIIMWLRGLDE